MKAIHLKEFGSIEGFEEVDLAIPKPKRNEVRVKVEVAAFNPVDAKIRSGIFGGDVPIVLGADFSGVIDAVGEPFHDFAVGDEVCGFSFGPISNGSYAEYLCLPTQLLVKKPKNLNLEEAAAFPLTYLTAFQAMISKGAFQEGRPLFIAGGSGGVGSATIALAKCYNAGPIFTTGGSQASQDYLQERFSLPKENILSYKGLNVAQMREKLIAMNGGESFYFALDFVGGEMKELCFEVTEIGGHLATILPEENPTISAWGRGERSAFDKSLSLHIIFLGAAAIYGDGKDWTAYHVQLKHLVNLFEKEGLLPPRIEVIGDLSVETVREAHTRLEEGHTQGKLIMNLSH